jgi:hypothetical protein
VTRTDDGAVVMMPLSEYLDYLAQPADPRPLYLATWTIGSDNGNAALFRDDYQVPEHFRPCWQTRLSWIDPLHAMSPPNGKPVLGSTSG